MNSLNQVHSRVFAMYNVCKYIKAYFTLAFNSYQTETFHASTINYSKVQPTFFLI